MLVEAKVQDSTSIFTRNNPIDVLITINKDELNNEFKIVTNNMVIKVNLKDIYKELNIEKAVENSAETIENSIE